MTKKFFMGMHLASVLAFSMMENGSYGLCSADDDAGGGGDVGGSGGGTALTSSDPAQAEAAKVPSLGDAMYGDKPKTEDKPNPPEPAKKDKQPKADDKPEGWKEYVADPNKTADENAAAKAEHDKTKPDEKDKKDEQPVIKAEEYEFVDVPEGFELDPAVDKEFREFAAARNWTKEDVKELSSLQVKLYEKQSEAHAQRVEAWGEELKTDKEIGGRAYDANMSKAREAKLAFFPDEVNAILDRSGLGNHPAFVKGFVRIGKAMGELNTLPGKPAAPNLSILDRMYGGSDGA